MRTYRAERDRRVILTLDTGRTSAGRVGDLPRLDHVLDAAQLLAVLAVRAGDRVDLVAHDALPRAALRGRALGGATLPRLVNALSTIEPALVEADHVGLATAVLRMSSRRALVVLFTDLLPAVVEESLLPALPALTERHVAPCSPPSAIRESPRWAASGAASGRPTKPRQPNGRCRPGGGCRRCCGTGGRDRRCSPGPVRLGGRRPLSSRSRRRAGSNNLVDSRRRGTTTSVPTVPARLHRAYRDWLRRAADRRHYPPGRRDAGHRTTCLLSGGHDVPLSGGDRDEVPRQFSVDVTDVPTRGRGPPPSTTM